MFQTPFVILSRIVLSAVAPMRLASNPDGSLPEAFMRRSSVAKGGLKGQEGTDDDEVGLEDMRKTMRPLLDCQPRELLSVCPLQIHEHVTISPILPLQHLYLLHPSPG